MDEDDTLDSGIGALAAFQLGAWSAEDAAHTRRAVRSLFNRPASAVDVQQLMANNQTLAAENARLRQELADYKLNYERLHGWAQGASRDLKRYRGEAD